jgi:hypothetical protein
MSYPHAINRPVSSAAPRQFALHPQALSIVFRHSAAIIRVLNSDRFKFLPVRIRAGTRAQCELLKLTNRNTIGFARRILNLLKNVDLSSLPHRILVATMELWVAAWLVGETTAAATGYPGTVG